MGKFTRVRKEVHPPHWSDTLLSLPHILHLYQQYDCFTKEEEDLLTITADEVVYKLGPEAEMADTGTEDSNDLAVP